MRVFLAVIEDLYHFATKSLFSLIPAVPKSPQALLPNPASAVGVSGLNDIPLYHAPSLAPAAGMLYFIGEQGAQLYADPVVAFDVVVKDIPYGEEVRLQKLGGRWGNVRHKNSQGWVFKDVLREQARDVFPVFEAGVAYDAESMETKKLRLCIGDMFCGGKAVLMLTDAEFVTYKLHRKGRVIAWSDERPRTPGTWQKILRGTSGIHAGIHPKTDSVMEYSIDDIGYVSFVEAVFPDDSIKVSGVGLIEDGVYSERMLSKDEWKELRPVFIEVT